MAEKMVKAKALHENIEGQGNKIGEIVDVPAGELDKLIERGIVEEAPKDNKKKEQDKK